MKTRIFFLFVFISFIFMGCNSLGFDPTERNYDNHVSRYSIGGENLPLEKKSEHEFTLAVIPDIQSYTQHNWQTERIKEYPMNQFEILNRQMEYVVANSEKNGGPIPFAIVLGDMVEDFHWYPYEWKKADEGLSILIDELPYGFIIGNHDYDHQVFQREGGYHVKGTRLFRKYFGPESKYFKNKSWFGGSSKSGMSTYSIFNGGGQDFLFLGLEMEPSDEELNWADSIVKQFSDLPVIVATHSYLRIRKESEDSDNAAYLGLSYRDPEGYNSPKQIFDKLVYPNKNILFVLCGHFASGDASESTRLDYNEAGYPVYSILTDYQDRRELYKVRKYPGVAQECGDGWLRLMEFDMLQKHVHCKTYSTEFHTYETDEDSDFVIKFDFDWDERFKK